MSLLKWPWLNTQTASTVPKPTPPPPDTPPPSPPPDNSALATARWDHKRFGMENFGNTCYANSVLQALYFCDPFRQLVCDAPDRSYPTTPEAIAAAQAAVAQLHPPAPPATPKPKPAHVRRPSAADMTTPAHAGFAVGPGGLVASAFMGPPAAVPHKMTSAPTPAPIVNVGPVIPPLPPSLFSALRSLFIHIAANPADKGTVSPRAFVEKLKKENELFRSNMHQDAHEFLNYLLNSVVEDLTHEMKAGPPEDLSKSVASTSSASNCSPHLTLVHDLFEGTLTSETRCLTCETVSSRDESFLDLSIDIERNSSVTACLRQFSASEMLCRGDKFFCDSCCGLQEAEKRMKIKKLPNVLALHLKRFKYQEDVQRYIKLSYRVAFPFELRLFNTVDDAEDPDRLYELFAIIVHVGSGPHHGHYITLAKQRGQWFAFDDDVVEPVQESAIPKYFGDSPAGSGYVLFYQAVNTDLQALGLKNPQVASVPSQPIIPPVVVEAPTSTVAAVPVQSAEEMVVKVSPDVSESGTIATPSPSTPTLSHPSSSPTMSKPEGLPPSTAPSSTGGSGFGRQSTKPPSGSSGSVQQLSEPVIINGHDDIQNGHKLVHEPTTKTGRGKGLSGSWFGWPGKKKDKEKDKDKGTPASSRKATLDDANHLPIIDIRRPSAPALMESSTGQAPAVNGTSVLHDEPEEAPGLGVDFGRTTEPALTGSTSASSSGDHLLHHSVPDHRHLRTSPPRVSRSGSVSATTNGSTGSGLHVPSYSPSRPSPSPSSSASSVSTPLRHNASAPKLGVAQSIAPFPLTMSPVKERKRPSTASSIPPKESPLTIVPPIPTLSPPPAITSPVRSHTIGPVDALQTTKVKTAKRKLSFSNALNSFARRDKSLGKLGAHDRRTSIIEGAEGLSPLVVPTTPTKRK
ncbi:unnamed protein product [Rhizoctonia solani]|uniref:Ubiquitin carboxyl-terminal hydrolase n=1 Tax=Rhizoctonia solani TaxID=456999 RepID=A0A8H2ZX68_9AGAM|nr:unnamed protein product [Rhizoctonia solani]